MTNETPAANAPSAPVASTSVRWVRDIVLATCEDDPNLAPVPHGKRAVIDFGSAGLISEANRMIRSLISFARVEPVFPAARL